MDYKHLINNNHPFLKLYPGSLFIMILVNRANISLLAFLSSCCQKQKINIPQSQQSSELGRLHVLWICT